MRLMGVSRPGSTDQISSTVAAVLSDYCKSSERTIFWNDELKMNVDPFHGLEGGIFTADWDFKVSVRNIILRGSVEFWPHSPQISSKYCASWWNCNCAITRTSRARLIAHGAYHKINTRRKTPRLLLPIPQTPTVRITCSLYLLDRTLRGNVTG